MIQIICPTCREIIKIEADEVIDVIMNQRDDSKTEGVWMSKNTYEKLKVNQCHCKKLKQKPKSIKPLKEFARYVIDSECFGNIDGGDIQEKAEQLGLIKLCKLTEGDYKNHSEYYNKEDIGTYCIYHFTDLIKDKGDF